MNHEDAAIVVSIGCLECHNESDLLGLYESVAAAQVAWPEAQERTGLTSYIDFTGSDMQVIFRLPNEFGTVGDK